ncbi:DUF3592 domain-containing protein [Burkholderia sola]|uniref:DUF3592 domain-containing protein n=1 Tax=Burkholderia sola TaxID=2843302 RepID=UPI001C0A8BF6|nr:hypothetical protein BCCR75389_05631 [Burkholderia cenocepacia]CAG2351313.1 hypothetical protein BCCR75388_05656 [Burkholderia cenocepacia]CAG2351355.1 hypothetical protein BCCR75384_05656 [Burkholderia cenocepacia]CAG2351377.1 hypothetical protein BCCR75386_05656 [Burkholderia cenocepacia]CAG2351506.1 hypothetical protein BCCR75387_05653 [Burkholderia cenocepacia]
MASEYGRPAARHTGMQIAKGVVFAIVGTCILIGVALYAQSTREFLRTSVVVPGRVVKLNAGTHHPEIAFTTLTGERVEYAQGGDVSVQDGATVEVRYAPDAPKMTARMNTFGAIWGGVLAIGAMGAVFFAVGVGQLWSGVRAWRSGRNATAR